MPQQAAQMPVVQRHLTLCHCPGKRLGIRASSPAGYSQRLRKHAGPISLPSCAASCVRECLFRY
jgi:hypothetical protein